MKISICIPQYNRIEYLLKNLEIIEKQTYPDVEIIISDDCSTDRTEEEIRGLKSYKFPIIYHRNTTNIGYDANVRKSLELASGRYCMLIGNDDSLFMEDGLQKLAVFLQRNDYPEIGFCNYVEFTKPGEIIKRASTSQVVGSGPQVALNFYRSFSFVAGVVIRKDVFDAVNTDKMDGSIYVQMYIAARVIGGGGRFFMFAEPVVLKDIQIEGKIVNSYRDTLPKKWKDFKVADGGFRNVVRAVVEGFKDAGVASSGIRFQVLKGIYKYTYPYWLLDYRYNNSFVAAVGLMKGLKPSAMPFVDELKNAERMKIYYYYYLSSSIGLTFPPGIFKKIKNSVYNLIKR